MLYTKRTTQLMLPL